MPLLVLVVVVQTTGRTRESICTHRSKRGAAGETRACCAFECSSSGVIAEEALISHCACISDTWHSSGQYEFLIVLFHDFCSEKTFVLDELREERRN